MARRGREQHPWTNQPGRLVIHDDPYDIYAKLNWEANEFELKRTNPEKPIDVDGMVYLLQNACISAASLVEWLEKAAHAEARSQGKQIDKTLLEKEVLSWLPDLALARAIANTFKHATYRDEGWGNAEVRLEALFTAEQHTRLRAAEGTDGFAGLYEEEAAEADFALTFVRDNDEHQLAAEDFVLGLAHGGLRLLDHSFQDFDRFFAEGA
ncbi:hypothetical protein [Sphingomonas sp. NFR15]|uniref:hypothetical protein n=1 Tax=Sphingomonas sp. NFR15 TaxID=1566282 RepID=UPI00088CB7D9|nr:hypothetical protein [Sphingomonas sp. NFR15]SDA35737.1 hypothetical protein SAMN03159340_03347 [Sphingomonas sp. NFR15]